MTLFDLGAEWRDAGGATGQAKVAPVVQGFWPFKCAGNDPDLRLIRGDVAQTDEDVRRTQMGTPIKEAGKDLAQGNSGSRSPAPKNKAQQDKAQQDRALDEALKETFPASDPIAL